MEISDKEIKEIVRQAQTGNQEAFGQIYNLFFERIYKFIFFRTKQKEEAEDLASLVFLKVWQNLKKYKFQNDAKFSTWLFQITRFTLIDFYRRQKPQVSLENIGELRDLDKLFVETQINEVKERLLLLPEKYQTVITLKYFEDLSHKQIAEIMGKTSTGVRVMLHRALKKLANLMENYEK